MAIPVSIELELGQALTGLQRLEGEIKKATKAVEKPVLMNVEGNAVDVIGNINKEFQKSINTTKNYKNELRQTMAALISSGKEGTVEYYELEKQLKEVILQTKKFDDALEQVDRQMDSLNTAPVKVNKLGQAFSSMGSMLIGGGILGAVTAIGTGIAKVIDIGKQYETSLTEFSAITGVQGEALDNFGNSAIELSKKFGGSSIEQINSFKMVLSRLGPDLAKAPEALNSITNSINTLAKAGSIDAATSTEALTTAMLQFGVDLSNPTEAAREAERIINVMAAGAKEGAAEINQVSDALVVSGVAAKQANVSIEETNAAIQVLATGGKYGSEAGTALRNVLGKLAGEDVISGEAVKKLQNLGVNFDIVSNTALPLQDRLNELKKIQSDATLTAQIFGTENAAAASILMNNVDALGQLTEKITGTSTAYDQAATNMDTMAARQEIAKAKMEAGMLKVFEMLTPVLELAAEGLDMFMSAIESMSPILEMLGWLLNVVVNAIKFVGEMFKWSGGILDENKKRFDELNEKFQITETITNLISKALNWLGQAFQDVTKWIQGFMPQMSASAKESSWFVDVLKEAKKWLDILLKPLEVVWNKIREIAGTDKQKVKKEVKAAEPVTQQPNVTKTAEETGKKATTAMDNVSKGSVKAKTELEKLKEAFDKLNKAAENELLKTGFVSDKTLKDLQEANKQLKDAENKIKLLKEQLELGIDVNELRRGLISAFIPTDTTVEQFKKSLESKINAEPIVIKAEIEATVKKTNMEDIAEVFKETVNFSEMFGKDMNEGVINSLLDLSSATSEVFSKILQDGQVSFNELGDAALGALLETAKRALDIYTPQILAAFMSWLGPAGLPAGFAAIGIAKGLLSALGAEEGHIPGQNYGLKGNTDTQLIWVNPNEFIIPEGVSRREEGLLKHIVQGGRSEDYLIQNYRMNLASDNAIDYLKSIDRKLDNATLIKSERRINLNQEKVIIKEYAKAEYWR